MLLISGSLFVLNAETPVTPIKATQGKLSLNSNLRNQIDIRDLKIAVENLTKEINILKVDVQKLQEQAVEKKDNPTPQKGFVGPDGSVTTSPKDFTTPANVDTSTLLSEISNELYPPMPRRFWSQRPPARDDLQRLEYKLLGANPDSIFSEEKVKQFRNWLDAMANIKTSIPDSLKKDFTARVADMFKARPNYEEFIAAYKNDSNDKKRLEALSRRHFDALYSLKLILQRLQKNSFIFAPEAYPNIQADIRTLDSELLALERYVPKLYTQDV